MISGYTKLLGVIGHPIEHSLSPVMHNAAIAHLGIDYAYLPFPVAPADLAAAIAGFTAIQLQGFNVTIPHKQAIIPYLEEVSAIAQTVGAVNTVWRTATGWNGTNTDVEGFLAPLQERSRDWSHATALILGNGGAARAVVAGCAQLGFAEIWVTGRNLQKLAAFRDRWANVSALHLSTHAWDSLSALLPQSDLIVNTTPIGMFPNVNESPLSQDEVGKIKVDAIAYDLIYTPNPTQFLQAAQAQGAVAIDGLEMLIQQGAAALQLWLQQPVPINIMRQALQQHLGLIP